MNIHIDRESIVEIAGHCNYCIGNALIALCDGNKELAKKYIDKYSGERNAMLMLITAMIYDDAHCEKQLR